MNPVAGALTLLIVYRLGRLVYNRVVSLLALVFMLFSPFFLLHSASYFAHPSSLLFIILFVFFILVITYCIEWVLRWFYFHDWRGALRQPSIRRLRRM